MSPRKTKAVTETPTKEDLPTVVRTADVERLRAVCVRALELLRSQCKGNEHIEVQANALLSELEKT